MTIVQRAFDANYLAVAMAYVSELMSLRPKRLAPMGLVPETYNVSRVYASAGEKLVIKVKPTAIYSLTVAVLIVLSHAAAMALLMPLKSVTMAMIWKVTGAAQPVRAG